MSAFDDILPIQKKIIDLLIAEWVAQGHSLTGKFESSLEGLIESTENITITIMGSGYSKYIETGTPASKIPYKQGSGAKTSAYISALMNYAKLRFNLTTVQEQKSAAFAIARKQKIEGMPTRNSFQFSKTGKRTNFVDETIKKILKDKTAETTVFKIYEGKIINILKEHNKSASVIQAKSVSI